MQLEYLGIRLYVTGVKFDPIPEVHVKVEREEVSFSHAGCDRGQCITRLDTTFVGTEAQCIFDCGSSAERLVTHLEGLVGPL